MAIKKDTEGSNVVQIGRATGQMPSASQLTDTFMTLSLDDKPCKKDEPQGDAERISVQICKSNEQQSSTAQLTDKFTTLTLNTKQIRRAEPQEDDECPDDRSLQVSAPGAADKTDLKDDDEDSKRCDSLVKLEAPKEENEDSEENDTDDPDKLGDRGPTNGCASHYAPVQNDFYFQGLSMPENFPNYSHVVNGYQGNKNKRSLDKRDLEEPYKYVKPQNNLSNPHNVSVVSNVNQKQMSGGTVVTSPDVHEAEIPSSYNFFSSAVNSGYQDTDNDMVNLPLDEDFENFLQHSSQGQQASANFPPQQTLGMNIYEKLYDDGYQSDNLQSPTPSPQEYNSSSPQTPMSHQSGDSGICSPMSEDSLHTQVKSPSQTSCDTYRLKASPHHCLASPQYAMVPSPPQHTAVQPTQLQNFQPEFLTPLLPSRYQQVDSTFSNWPIQALQQSVYRHEGQEHFHHPDVDSKLFDLQLALSVIGEDLTEELRNKAASQQAQVMPAFNIPTTVASPVDDTERVPQGSSQVNRLEKTTQNSPVQKKSPSHASTGPTHTAPPAPPPPPLSQQLAKMPIPNLRKPTAPQVMVVNNGPVPVILFQPLTQPRYKEIRPKEPSTAAKPVNNVPEGPNARANCSPLQSTQQSPPPPSPSQPTQNQANKVSLITLARRIVAEMLTSELEKKDVDGDTVLHVTVCRPGCLDLVQALLERLVREQRDDLINARNYMGQTPLYLAVSSNHPKVVKILIEKNADVNPFAECRLPSGVVEKSAAIHCASSRGEKYLQTLKELLKSPDINVDQFNSDGHTPLNCAILCHGKIDADGNHIDSIPIIQALIEGRANPNLQTQKSGKTSLMYALESRDINLIERIFQLVDPVNLPSYLKNNAFDGSTCQKIADSLRPTLSPTDQQRLTYDLFFYFCLNNDLFVD
ncbi:hypothetical protein Btru_021218 [Bulinus truncatus]|nr:hypothetical protein Btru_021218 [Bulinus truncatus]